MSGLRCPAPGGRRGTGRWQAAGAANCNVAARAASRGRLTSQEQSDIVGRVRPVGGFDAAATAGVGLPMGPLARLDLIGLDTPLSIMEVLRDEFGGGRYVPAPLLAEHAAAGLAFRH
jgi:hypothetical protein